MRLLFTLLSVILLQGSVYAFDTLKIDGAFRHKKVREFGYIYQGEVPKLTIDDILQLPKADFLSFGKTGIALSPTYPTYCATAILKNQTDTILHLMFEIQNGALDHVQFFIQKNYQIDSSSVMGVPYPLENRLIAHRSFLYPIALAPYETQQLYVYVRSRGQVVLFDAHLSTTSYFHKKDKQQTFWWNIYFGVLFCICALGLIAALITLNKVIVYFTLYCIFGTNLVLFASGIGLEYIWKSFENSILAGGYINLIPMLFAFLGLTKSFLKTAIHLPQIHKIIRSLQFLLIFVFFPVTAAKYYISDWTIIIFTYLGQVLQLAIILTVIITSIQTYRKTKKSVALAFLMSFIFFLMSMIFYSLARVSNVIETNTFFRYGIYIFWLFDMLFLMGLLAYNIRTTFLSNLKLQQQLTQSQLNAANLLIEGQLEERKRLSRELHDGISIKMALLKMRLNEFFNPKNKETAAVINEINTISEDIRNFTHAISPLDLEKETLEDAIEDLIYKIENQTGLEVNLSFDLEEQLLKKNQKHTLYQILQELFNNTIKYAEATLVKIQLSIIGNQLELSYQDNGKGFDTNSVNAGIGLKNIQARIDLLNGIFNIHSNQDGSRFEFSFKI